MNNQHIVGIAQIKEFSKLNSGISFSATSRKERYVWIETTLTKFRYFKLKKKDRSIVKNYILEMTGVSDAQLGRLIAKKKN